MRSFFDSLYAPLDCFVERLNDFIKSLQYFPLLMFVCEGKRDVPCHESADSLCESPGVLAQFLRAVFFYSVLEDWSELDGKLQRFTIDVKGEHRLGLMYVELYEDSFSVACVPGVIPERDISTSLFDPPLVAPPWSAPDAVFKG